MIKIKLALTFYICLYSLSSWVYAHPWGGLVVDNQGDIYFSFVCPMWNDEHYACIWKLDKNNNLTTAIQAKSTPSDFIVSRSASRQIFAAERSGKNARLWQLENSEWTSLVEPTNDRQRFNARAFTVNDNGEVIFAYKNELYLRNKARKISKLKNNQKLGGVQSLGWKSNQLSILDYNQGAIKLLYMDGTVKTIVDRLKKASPGNLPFKGANVLFDFAFDNDGNGYVAYYGDRKILKISPQGKTSTFLESEDIWLPHGVDVYQGDVYVLESTYEKSKWRPWAAPKIIPRIRKVDANGKVSVLYQYSD